jgi:TolA-binding protein
MLSLFAAALLTSLTLPAAPATAQKGGGQRRAAAGNTPEEIFSLGFFYYNNSDIRDDNAAKQFQRVIKNYPKSEEAERAQFFLASYYQRKYYIRKERYGEPDPDALNAAENEYAKYIRDYPNGGPCQCLSDAYFHLALVHLQQGNHNAARHQLTRLSEEAGKDPAVYVYQVVWSSNSNDVIDSHFDAKSLAEHTSRISGLPFSDAVSLLKRWCRDQKSKK